MAMWDRIERLTASDAEAISLDEAKEACRIDGADDDAFLARAIKAAREMVEGPDGAGLALIASEWQLRLDGLPSEIWIPMGPVISVDRLEYLDEAGELRTIAPAAYQWRKGRFEARIKPAYGLAWPSLRSQYDAVRVTFTAGFAGTDAEPPSLTAIPEPLRIAMLMLISHWNENRESVVVGQLPSEIQHGFRDLINRYRVGRFG
ncbi:MULTISPECIES: head-tail connector protein [Rhodomicrobium]|uniref:head-tail connector protein n=1 Tax=Rhodomicrobium TaxID=1068 RepID=UPI000B4ACA7C|nr:MULTISPECIES: head-tail connector protein [Rhodomicrobium]